MSFYELQVVCLFVESYHSHKHKHWKYGLLNTSANLPVLVATDQAEPHLPRSFLGVRLKPNQSHEVRKWSSRSVLSRISVFVFSTGFLWYPFKLSIPLPTPFGAVLFMPKAYRSHVYCSRLKMCCSTLLLDVGDVKSIHDSTGILKHVSLVGVGQSVRSYSLLFPRMRIRASFSLWNLLNKIISHSFGKYDFP